MRFGDGVAGSAVSESTEDDDIIGMDVHARRE